MANQFLEDDQPFQENIIAYGDNIHASSEYDSDTSLSSTHSEKSIDISMSNENNKSFISMLKSASQSRYNPSNFDIEIRNELYDADSPPNDKKSFVWGIILMFVAAFLFSITTQIIKINHSFGRESFEIFVFRMFIQLLVTSCVASISVVMNHHYSYGSVAMFSAADYDSEEGNNNDTETECDYESDPQLGQLKKRSKNIKAQKNCFGRDRRYKSGENCCQIRCVWCANVFFKFWTDSTTQTKLYILLRGICGGTGAVSYYWSVSILPINDTIFILSLFPVFTTVFSHFILQEKVTKKHLFYLLIGMVGILFMCYPSFIFGKDDRDDIKYNILNTNGSQLVQGYGFAMVSCICYGFVFIFIRLAYKAPTFALIFSNGLFGLCEAILICALFKRFVPIPELKDWLIAIGIGCIGYLAQNAENRSGKYVFASTTSVIRVTEVFWEYVWQNLLGISNTDLIQFQSIGAACLALSIILIISTKYSHIKDIEISNALEGVMDYDYDTDYNMRESECENDILDLAKKKKKRSRTGKYKHGIAKIVHKLCHPRLNQYQKIQIDGI